MTAEAVAAEVTRRVADPAVLRRAIDDSRRQTTLPTTVGWRDQTVAAGFAGTALLFAAADARWPGHGWDRCGHRHLAAAGSALESASHVDESLFTGLAGVGFAAVTLAGDRDRYGRLLAAIDRVLLPRVATAVRRLDRVDGCGVGAFDLISGLTGTGVYLLARSREPDADRALRTVLACLARLLADRREPCRWHTPAAHVGEVMSALYPHGCHNCGLAHGLPGPLALLALATRDGVRVDGAQDAVAVAAGWLAEHRIEEGWGPDWPNAVGLPGPDAPPATRPSTGPSRAAWCYGAPGVARSLWLAAEALGDAGHRDLALRTMQAVVTRRRGLTSPTFCHGTAGLAQIALRFAHDTGRPELVTAADALVADVVEAFEPGSVLGYRNVEPGGVRVDHPGLLDGAPGVALTLLTADRPEGAAWDRLFLLS